MGKGRKVVFTVFELDVAKMYDVVQISVVDLISIVFIPIIICPIHYILHKLFFVVVENIIPTTVANFPQITQKSNELVIRLFLTLNKNIYKIRSWSWILYYSLFQQYLKQTY